MKKMLLFVSILVLILSGFYYAQAGTGYIRKYFTLKTAENINTGKVETDSGKISANIKTIEPIEPSSAIIPSPAQSSAQEAKPLVAIDPGHGGADPGTSGGGLNEKDISLDIANKLDKILKNNGVNTYMIRTDDSFMDHKERIQLANSKDASLFISIHCDWFNNPSYGGTQTLYYPSKELKKGNLNEIQYANYIQNELLQIIKTNNRGIVDRPNLAVLRQAKMPSVLVELGFLSNKTDVANLGSQDFRQKVAEGLANGIMKSLKEIG